MKNQSTLTFTFTVNDTALMMAALKQTADTLDGQLKLYSEIEPDSESLKAVSESVSEDITNLRRLRGVLLSEGVPHV